MTLDPIRDGSNWYAYVGNDPINFVDPWGLDIIKVNDFAESQDNNDASQESLGGGEVHTDWEHPSTIRNYGCVYTAQVNASNAANAYFNTGNTTDFVENNNADTFGDDQLISDDERAQFQEKTTGLNVTTYRVEGNEEALKEIEELQSDPGIVATVEGRVRGGSHSININGITREPDGKSSLDYFETAEYFGQTKNTPSDITGIRVNIYTKEQL